MFDTIKNKGILPFKLNSTFCASFVFWGRFFLYFVNFETKFAESFFLKIKALFTTQVVNNASDLLVS
jgi:hypothetical protein